MTTDPPRRKWHLTRWLLVGIIATLGWSSWRAYTFRSALSQARALGWEVGYIDPFEQIQQNWKVAFAKATWLSGVIRVGVGSGEELKEHSRIVLRLNPKDLFIDSPDGLRDLTALEGLTRIQFLLIARGKGLTNIDTLRELTSLRRLDLLDCPVLTDIRALSSLKSLKQLHLRDCRRLTDIDELNALVSLTDILLDGCSGLKNVNALKYLSSLERIALNDCESLTSVDSLKSLSSLHTVNLSGCTGLTPESVAALKAALPKVTIHDP